METVGDMLGVIVLVLIIAFIAVLLGIFFLNLVAPKAAKEAQQRIDDWLMKKIKKEEG